MDQAGDAAASESGAEPAPGPASLTAARVESPSSSEFLDLRPRIVALLLGSIFISTLLISRSYLAHGSPLGDDNSSHLAEIRTIARALREGRSDFWFDQNLLGYPLFIAYQPLPSLIMGAVVGLTESFVDPVFLYKLSIVVLWGAMPAFWYLGGRWMGFERTIGLLFGLLILHVRDAWDFGIGFNSTVRYGLYTQLWATALVPLAFGSVFRYVYRRDLRLFVPATLLALVLLCHLILGYLCLGGTLLLVPLGGTDRLRGLARAALALGVSLLLCAFWLIPFLLNAKYQGGFPYRWESSDGYPLSEAARRVFAGDVLDTGRLPLLTILGLAGLAASLRRWKEVPLRWAASFGFLCFLFWLGPRTWGDGYRRLPFHAELQVVRYLAGLQFAALFFGAEACRSLMLLLDRRVLSGPSRVGLRKWVEGVVALVMAMLVWSWLGSVKGSLITFDSGSKDYSELVDYLSKGQGRFLCHERLGTADHFHCNLLPLLARRPHVRTFGRGYHDTLSLFYLDHVQFSDADLRLYHIRHLVARTNPRLDEGVVRLAWSNSSYQVYEAIRPSSYFEFLHAPVRVQAQDFKTIRDLLLEIVPVLIEHHAIASLAPGLSSAADRIEVQDPVNGVTLIVDGRPLAERVPSSLLKYEMLRKYSSLPRIESRVERESAGPNEYRAQVDVRTEGVPLVLKASFHPYWEATVDDVPARVVPVAPNLMAVDIPAGRHSICFKYRNPIYQKVSALVTAVLWVGWAGALVVGSVRRLRNSSRRKAPGPVPPAAGGRP